MSFEIQISKDPRILRSNVSYILSTIFHETNFNSAQF